MTKLIRYVDKKALGCWARIDMASGENCYISSTSGGLTIKESNLGLFGRIVFKADLNTYAYVAMKLHANQDDDLTPSDIQSPHLKVVVNEILHCANLDEVYRSFQYWKQQYELWGGRY